MQAGNLRYDCGCNEIFTNYQKYRAHKQNSKEDRCSLPEVTEDQDDTFDDDDENGENDYMPSHNQQIIDSISGEVAHDHPDRVDNDIGDITYQIIQEQVYESLYGKDALIATSLQEFYNLSIKPDNKTKVETDIYDFVTRNNISRNEADKLINIIKSCATAEYIEIISGKNKILY